MVEIFRRNTHIHHCVNYGIHIVCKKKKKNNKKNKNKKNKKKYLDVWTAGRKEERSREDRDIGLAQRIVRRSDTVSHTPLHTTTPTTFLISGGFSDMGVARGALGLPRPPI